MLQSGQSVRASISTALSFESPALVNIDVGKQSKKFTAHESFLKRSEFFRRALNGNWQEAESRTVKLPDDDPRIFGVYLNLVYTGQLNTVRKTPDELELLDYETIVHHIGDKYDDLIQLYIVAEKLRDVAAKNASITAVVNVAQVTTAKLAKWFTPRIQSASIVYDGTPEGSLLRCLFIELVAGATLSYILNEVHKRQHHPDFIKISQSS